MQEIKKSVTIVLPFDIRLSKNERLKHARLGFIPKNIKQLKDSFVLAVRAYAHEFIETPKLDISIIVHRPNGHSDPQNFVDELSDIIQAALNINDRNFKINVDGNIRKENPAFEIIIRRE